MSAPSNHSETRENLEKSRKPDLRERCREMGLSNIWVRKDQLINMILQHQRNTAPRSDDALSSVPAPTDDTTPQDAASQPPRQDEDHAVQREPSQLAQQNDTQAPHNDSSRALSEADLTHHSNHSQLHQPDTHSSSFPDLHNIATDIESIKNQLRTKDMEIELLNEEVKAAYETIQLLQTRVNHLEQELHSNASSEQPVTRSPTSPLHCLLLGDSNLRRVSRSDLANNCSIKTIHDANIDLLRSWVTETMNQAPSVCVIYCGINDIIEESPSDKILDNLGSLTSVLKEKKPDIKLYICQVVPPAMLDQLSAQTEAYNDHLLRWGESNGVTIIKTLRYFGLSTGDLDDLCFECGDDSSLFSRLGAIRLLDSINAECSEFNLCNNWKTIKKTLLKVNNVDKSTPTSPSQSPPHHLQPVLHPQPHRPTPRGAPHPPRGLSPHDAASPRFHVSREHLAAAAARPGSRPSPIPAARGSRYVPGSGAARRGAPPRQHGVEQSQSVPVFAPYHAAPRHGCLDCGEFNHSPPTTANTSPVPAHHWNHFVVPGRDVASRGALPWHHGVEPPQPIPVPVPVFAPSHAAPRRGCYNCGEVNHRQATCRYDHRLRCGNCRLLGHKGRLCQRPIV